MSAINPARLSLAAAILTLLVLSGCYDPDGEYFKDVKVIEPTATIDLTGVAEGDTIVLTTPTEFHYKVSSSTPTLIQSVDLLIDSGQRFTSHFTEGTFLLSQDFLSPGFYKLTIRFSAKSNSGSLADVLDAEHYQVWRSWVLSVRRYDTTPPSKPALRVVEANGLLKVEWDTYSQKTFTDYTLHVRSTNNREIVFTDSLQTFWYDSNFLYGTADYTLTLSNSFGSSSSSIRVEERNTVTFDFNEADSMVSIKWHAPKYYNALSHVSILENQTVRTTTSNPADTSYTYKITELIWGKSTWVNLKIQAKDPRQNSYEWSISYQPPGIREFSHVMEMYYQNGNVLGHSISSNLMFTFDNDMRPTDSVTVYGQNFAVPSSGPYIYFSNNGSAIRWNTSTGEKIHIADYPGFTISGEVYGSSNGLLSYSAYDREPSWDMRASRAILNTNDNTFIQRVETSYDPKQSIPPFPVKISDDGRYGFERYGQKVIRFNEGMIENIGSISDGWFFSFRSDNNNEILVASSQEIKILSSSDLSVLRTFPIPAEYSIVSYDPVTHYILCERLNAKTVHLINIDDGDQITYPAYSTGWSLMNGYLIYFGVAYKKIL